jgi:colicin import membrane protein
MNFIIKHKNGLIGTILFHGILLLIFIIAGFTIPYPPPPEEGVLINFGTSDVGTGDMEPALNDVSSSQTSNEGEYTLPDDKGKVITQDFEDAAGELVNNKTQTNKKINKKDLRKNQVKSVTNQQTFQNNGPKVNKLALYPGKSTTGSWTGGEGEGGGPGNQGDPNGDPNSKSRTGGYSGNGKGISFNLNGRNSLSLPKPEYNYQVEGVVVVEVTVDKQGRVTNAYPGIKGSTTLDDNLLNAAKKAAMIARFDIKNNAPAYQKGTITYHFKLQ